MLSDLDGEVRRIRTACDEEQRSCQVAEAALREANPNDKDTIKEEGALRRERFLRLDEELERLQRKRDALYDKLLDQEAYLSRFELLDFLRSRRYAITPRNLANAVAGLPQMRWRQSFVRCSRMPFDKPILDYRVFVALSDIWNARPKNFEQPPVEFFRTELLRLRKKLGYTGQFLCENWRDLRLAIEECWKSKPSPTAVAFLLASTFTGNRMRQKNAAEQVLADLEKLEA